MSRFNHVQRQFREIRHSAAIAYSLAGILPTAGVGITNKEKMHVQRRIRAIHDAAALASSFAAILASTVHGIIGKFQDSIVHVLAEPIGGDKAALASEEELVLLRELAYRIAQGESTDDEFETLETSAQRR